MFLKTPKFGMQQKAHNFISGLPNPNLFHILIFTHAKTKAQISRAVTAQLISAFVFALWIVQFLQNLCQKFQTYSLLQVSLCLTLLEFRSPVLLCPCSNSPANMMYIIINIVQLGTEFC